MAIPTHSIHTNLLELFPGGGAVVSFKSFIRCDCKNIFRF